MSINLKIFFIAFLVCLPLFWGLNWAESSLKQAFFQKEINENPYILIAQANQRMLQDHKIYLENAKPFKKEAVKELNLKANSVISFLAREGLKDRILFEQQADTSLAIASLSKIMAAHVILKNYDLEKVVTVSEQAVREEEEAGFFTAGQQFTVKDLLHSLLMESSNDAAFALTEVMGRENFIDTMNQTASNLGLLGTYFVNPTGLDPDPPETAFNYSTAKDLVNLTVNSFNNTPLIWEILSKSQFNLYTAKGLFHHTIYNTNEFLQTNHWKTEILGGKTGWTPLAGGCLLLVMEAPHNQGFLVNVILGSNDRFGEMKKLVDWIYNSYKW